MMTHITFFCETCNAGPWSEGAKGSGGVDIIQSHIKRGCRVVEYSNVKHHDLSDSINDFIDQLNENQKKRKDERELRIEKYGTPIDQIESYLNTQIKEDPILVKQILRVYFSAYTDNPINMAILAPSSDGKTYATVQVSKIFPKEDFISVGRLSPTALIHQHGIMVDEDGNSIEEKLKQLDIEILEAHKAGQKDRVEELKNEMKNIFKTAKNLVDLTNKVLLFLDNPSPQTFEMLKPILSHDKEEILYKTTKGDGSLKVKETIIRGAPATIVCSAKDEAKNEVWPEIETRFFMAAPNSNISKYKAANKLTSLKFSLPPWASSIYDDPEDKKWAKYYVGEIINLLKNRNPLWCPLYELVDKYFPDNQGVMMRHYVRLLSFCNVETMINANQRPILSYRNTNDEVIKTVVGTFEDISNAIDTLGKISTISPEKLKFYDDIFVPLFKEKNSIQTSLHENPITDDQKGVTSQELAEKYTSVYNKPINAKKILENYLFHLEHNGLVQWEPDETKGNRHLYKPISDISIHNLHEIKSKLIEESKTPKFINDYVILCLKLLLNSSTDFRKSNVFFSLNHKILNLQGLVSEIRRNGLEKKE